MHRNRCDTIRYDTIRHYTTRNDTLRYDTTRYDTIRFDTIRYNTIRYDPVRYNTIRYVMILFDSIHCNTINLSCDVSVLERLKHILRYNKMNERLHATKAPWWPIKLKEIYWDIASYMYNQMFQLIDNKQNYLFRRIYTNVSIQVIHLHIHWVQYIWVYITLSC